MPDPELDVDIGVIEQPEQPNFPRRPNVVSHRGHKFKFNVSIKDVPRDTTHVTISAKVFTYGPERVGEASHVSRSRRQWGKEEPKAFKLTLEDLPATVGIVVEKDPEDDHLGQGPYEAVITVNSSTGEPDLSNVIGGDDYSIEFVSM